MLNKILKIFPFVLYFFVLILISIGVFKYEDSSKGLKLFLIYSILFLFSVICIQYLFLKKYLTGFKNIIVWMTCRNLSLKHSLHLLILSLIIYLIIYYSFLGYIPILKALLSYDYYEIVKIRQYIPDESGSFFNYLNSFLLRSILPTGLVLLYINRSKHFKTLLILSSILALSLIQKSYIVLLMFPLIMILLLYKKWLQLFLASFFVVFCVYFLMIATNPALRNKEYILFGKTEKLIETHQNIATNVDNAQSGVILVFSSIAERVLVIPGFVVSQWSDLIPDKIPFSKGCSYRLLAKLMNCNFQNTALEIYNVLNPELVEKGIMGSVNAASFMQDYANFGYVGLFYSALILSTLLFFIKELFYDNLYIGISLNSVPILLLSSVSLSSTIVSGGWLLTLSIYMLFKSDFLIKKV